MTKTRGKLHINFFCKITMKKCIVDIHLINLPLLSRNKTKNGTDSVHFDNRRKCLIKVFTFDLMVPLYNKLRFLSFYCAIRFILNLIHPKTTKSFFTRREITDIPHVFMFECIYLSTHSIIPKLHTNDILEMF